MVDGAYHFPLEALKPTCITVSPFIVTKKWSGSTLRIIGVNALELALTPTLHQ